MVGSVDCRVEAVTFIPYTLAINFPITVQKPNAMKKCRLWNWFDKELKSDWYRIQLNEMYYLLNPNQMSALSSATFLFLPCFFNFSGSAASASIIFPFGVVSVAVTLGCADTLCSAVGASSERISHKKKRRNSKSFIRCSTFTLMVRKEQKMEEELYNLIVKGNDLKHYVRRFQELTVLCPNMVPTTIKLLEAFIGGPTSKQ
ncbi:hypothetical protein Tco_0792974 [Tanacetum coccineum]